MADDDATMTGSGGRSISGTGRCAVGITLPVGPGVADAARKAEELGFDFVATGEHVAFHGPTPNAFIWLAAAAGATTRIRLVSTVTLLAQYPAVLAAKLVASLDHVSAGRFELGVGVGGEYPEEFRAVGVDPRQRGRRTDESIAVLRSLLDGRRRSFHGQFTSFDDVRIAPPAHQRTIPLWVAGRREAAMRRAGRFADVWLPYLCTPDQLRRGLEVVHAEAVAAGRAPGEVHGALYAWACVDDDTASARRRILDTMQRVYAQDFSALERYLVFGSPEDCVDRLRQYVQAGARAVVLSPAAPLDERGWERWAAVRRGLLAG